MLHKYTMLCLVLLGLFGCALAGNFVETANEVVSVTGVNQTYNDISGSVSRSVNATQEEAVNKITNTTGANVAPNVTNLSKQDDGNSSFSVTGVETNVTSTTFDMNVANVTAVANSTVATNATATAGTYAKPVVRISVNQMLYYVCNSFCADSVRKFCFLEKRPLLCMYCRFEYNCGVTKALVKAFR